MVTTVERILRRLVAPHSAGDAPPVNGSIIRGECTFQRHHNPRQTEFRFESETDFTDLGDTREPSLHIDRM